MPPITLVSVTFSGDARLSVLQALSVNRLFPAQEIVEYIVILNDPDPDALRDFFIAELSQTLSSDLWAKTKFLKPTDVVSAVDLEGAAGQRSQQVIKLGVAEMVTTEHYLLIDSKNHIVAPMSTDNLWTGGKIRTTLPAVGANWAPYLAASMEALGMSPSGPWAERAIPTITPILMIRSEVLALIAKLRGRYGNTLSRVFFETSGRATEFFLYYAHLRQEYGDDIPYVHSSPMCTTLFASWPQDDAMTARFIAATGEGGTPMFGVHRARVARLTHDQRQAIDNLWHQRLLGAQETSAWFFADHLTASADVSHWNERGDTDELGALRRQVMELEESVQRLQPRQSAWVPPAATVGKNCTLAGDVTLSCREDAPIIIGDTVRIYRGTEILGPVTIGSNVLINRDAYIRPNVTIGDGVFLGPFVRVVTDGHVIAGPTQRAGRSTWEPIAIGAGTWVGASTTILGGVTIGEGCVIAAGSLVNKDIPPHTVYGGVPAKHLKNLPATCVSG